MTLFLIILFSSLFVSHYFHILFIFRVTLEISCQMDFTMYPFDSHVCTFQVGSCKFLAFSPVGLHRYKA